MSLESYILRLQNDPHPSLSGRAVLGGLTVLESLYRKGVLSRREKEERQAVHAGIPVISVGNITAGGTGKTPCIVKLASLLLEKGRRPAILTRGYRGGLEKKGGIVSDGTRILVSQREAGDEPYMMAVKLPRVPVIAGKDRVVSAAAAKALGADVLLLDDGFQYWRLARDLDVVLLDATNPFGGGHLLPRGLLREPLEALGRAGLFLLTKADQVEGAEISRIRDVLHTFAPDTPVITSGHQPSILTALGDWPGKGETLPKKAPVVLLSGIGNPGAFARTAEDAGLSVKASLALPDHHRYGDEDLRRAEETARRCGAKAIVITEKDAVKIKENLHWKDRACPLFVLGIDLVLYGDGETVCVKQVEDSL